jgi:hypothetical protein
LEQRQRRGAFKAVQAPAAKKSTKKKTSTKKKPVKKKALSSREEEEEKAVEEEEDDDDALDGDGDVDDEEEADYDSDGCPWDGGRREGLHVRARRCHEDFFTEEGPRARVLLPRRDQPRSQTHRLQVQEHKAVQA